MEYIGVTTKDTATVGSTLAPVGEPLWRLILERSDETRDQKCQYLRQIKSLAEDKAGLNVQE